MVKWANDGVLQANDGKMFVNDGEMLVNDGEMLVNDGEMREVGYPNFRVSFFCVFPYLLCDLEDPDGTLALRELEGDVEDETVLTPRIRTNTLNVSLK